MFGDVIACARTFDWQWVWNLCIGKASKIGMYGATAASSANIISVIIVFFTFSFAFKREGSNSFPSVRVCRDIPSSAVQKICLRSSEKKIPKSIGSSTQPHLTQIWILKGQISIALYSIPNILMKRIHETFYCWWASFLGKNIQQTVSTYHIKCLCEII